MDRQAVHDEMEQARASFHQQLGNASRAEMRRRSNGTRWTNQQLLFHMLLGYLIIRALGNLVRLFGRLPPAASRGYARLLNAGTRPFDLVNYLGSWAGGTALGTRAQGVLFDRVITALHRRLDAETDTDLARGMHYPIRWDPFFTDYMTLADVYHFPTQHFAFHRAQLSLSPVCGSAETAAPGADTGVDDGRGELKQQPRSGVSPPPAQQGVGEQPDQQRS